MSLLAQIFSGIAERLLPPPDTETQEDEQDKVEARETVQQARYDVQRWEAAMAAALQGGKARDRQ